MLEILQRITRGRKKEKGIEALERFQSVLHLQSLAESIRDTSLCGLGQTAPNPVLSTLRWFRDEYEAHIYDRHCPSAVCAELVTYSIDAEKCKGCTLCLKKCPADAIVGTLKKPHYIVVEKCIGCGSCLDACRTEAITKV
jgi:NAD-dependent dihydropyrimidine dehydrogenase PreA subunit